MNPKPALSPTARQAGWSRRRMVVALLALALAVGAAFTVKAISHDKPAAGIPASLGGQTWPVKRGPLVLSLLASGQVKAKEVVEVKNLVSGDVKITWIIDEGTIVKAGDKLVELESSQLQENTIRQKIQVAQANTKYEQAKQNLENQKSTNKSDILIAQNKFDMAAMDLEKYIKGDYQQKIWEAEAEIKLAEAELERARDRLDGTRKLLSKGYVNRGELDADTLALTKCQIELDKAKNAKDLLEKYEYKREVSGLETAKQGADEELKRTKKNAEIELANMQVELESAKASLDLEQYQLERLETQLKNTVLYAPQAGMVVYAKNDWDNESSYIRIGTSVHYQQRIIDLPDFSTWRVEARIHESVIQQVKIGQQVAISIDAFQGQPLTGDVDRISVLPDSNRYMMDTKEYIVNVEVSTTTLPLRPGMTAKTEVMLDSLHDVLTVPVQAINTIEGKATCYVMAETGPRPQAVEVGMSNDRFAEIKTGLREGDCVMLSADNLATDSGKDDEDKPEGKDREKKDPQKPKKRGGDAPQTQAAKPGAANKKPS